MKKENCQLLINSLNALGVSINNEQMLKIALHVALMQEWNKNHNLTAITDENEIIIKHVLDSASILSKINIPESSLVADVGTGAGFPGMTIKILRPDLRMSLIESSSKKTAFLREVIQKIGLENTEIINKRVEDVASDTKYREKYSCVISRAVSSVVVLSEYALPLVSIGGMAIFYKSKGVFEELTEAKYAIELLGGSVVEITDVVVPFLSAERYLLSIKKVVHSPQRYPRKAGLPVKRPLKKQ